MARAAIHSGGQSGAVGVAASEPAPRTQVPIACTRPGPTTRPSARTDLVRLRFGVPLTGPFVSIAAGANVNLARGRLILLAGPSGSGKSSALSAIESHVAPSSPMNPAMGMSPLNVQQVGFSVDCAIIDEVAPQGDFAEAAALLTACGLGDASLWLRPYTALSEGEKFRARLARAISLQETSRAHLDTPCVPLLLCDEFCSGLHRRAARAIAHNLRKLVTRRGLCIVAACSADDLTADLDPDTVVQFASSGSCRIIERTPAAPGPHAFRRKLRIEPGIKRDYENFAAMHYRATGELGFVDRVFVLRQRADREPLGIVVYSHPALELALRNSATSGWFSRNPQRVNSHLRVLRRLVIHPDVRGCGLGHYLVRKTMPLLGTDYVECLAAMGEFNPVFERAGMTRIGQYDAPPGPKPALESLRAMDADPHSADFAVDIARRPAVRKIVAQAVANWYAATTATGEKRVERQSPETLARSFRGLIGVRPVYYLWCRDPNTQRKKRILRNEPKVKRGHIMKQHIAGSWRS